MFMDFLCLILSTILSIFFTILLIVLLLFAFLPKETAKDLALWIHYRIHGLWRCKCEVD